MNPFGLYDHKAQLLQAAVVGTTALLVRGRSVAVPPALAWALLGFVDWLAYSFGSGRWEDFDAISKLIAWGQLLVLLWGAAVVVRSAASRRTA